MRSFCLHCICCLAHTMNVNIMPWDASILYTLIDEIFLDLNLTIYIFFIYTWCWEDFIKIWFLNKDVLLWWQTFQNCNEHTISSKGYNDVFGGSGSSRICVIFSATALIIIFHKWYNANIYVFCPIS